MLDYGSKIGFNRGGIIQYGFWQRVIFKGFHAEYAGIAEKNWPIPQVRVPCALCVNYKLRHTHVSYLRISFRSKIRSWQRK
jgi:hypothetical protein